MNVIELDRALRKLRLSGMADVLETRLLQAQTENMTPIDLVSTFVADELLRRQDRLFEVAPWGTAPTPTWTPANGRQRPRAACDGRSVGATKPSLGAPPSVAGFQGSISGRF